jgi:hypothetical protein
MKLKDHFDDRQQFGAIFNTHPTLLFNFPSLVIESSLYMFSKNEKRGGQKP